jgi:hypothetical protein
MTPFHRLALSLAVFGSFPVDAATPDPMHLGEIQLKLVYRQSGTLSTDILHRDPPASAFNLVIGGIDEGGPADDAVVMVPVIGPKDSEEFSDVPLIVRVRQGRKIIAARTFGGALTQPGGADWKALYLPDVTCAGTIAIEATRGAERKTASFDFVCGE